VVEVGWVNNKVEDNNNMKRESSGKQTGYHYLTDNSSVLLTFTQLSTLRSVPVTVKLSFG
jgi:hypothetical protein